jgi:hypothetical protein
LAGAVPRAGQLMGEVGAAERDGEKEAQRRRLCIHLRWLRALRDLETTDIVAGRSVRRAAEKAGKSLMRNFSFWKPSKFSFECSILTTISSNRTRWFMR